VNSESCRWWHSILPGNAISSDPAVRPTGPNGILSPAWGNDPTLKRCIEQAELNNIYASRSATSRPPEHPFIGGLSS
jgi:hypothetical protein